MTAATQRIGQRRSFTEIRLLRVYFLLWLVGAVGSGLLLLPCAGKAFWGVREGALDFYGLCGKVFGLRSQGQGIHAKKPFFLVNLTLTPVATRCSSPLSEWL